MLKLLSKGDSKWKTINQFVNDSETQQLQRWVLGTNMQGTVELIVDTNANVE